MNLKKCLLFFLSILLLLQLTCISILATDTRSFRYEITVNGMDVVAVAPGDIITVTLYLYRTDSDKAYTMYAMQDEIRYDSEFLVLVPNSALPSSGISYMDIAVENTLRELYMNYVSMSGGAQWQSKTRIGSFQLKVIGESGVTTLTNEDFLVSLPDGSGSYKCESNTLTIIISTDCTVKFASNGGTTIAPVTAIYGELLPRPDTPVREGKYLVGWFKDIHLTEEWNFETDTVIGNMTLYAKWADGQPEPNEPVINTDSVVYGHWSYLILVSIVIVLFVAIYLIRHKSKTKNIDNRK